MGTGSEKDQYFYQEKLCALFGMNAQELGFLSPPAEDLSRKAFAQKTEETESTTTVPNPPLPLFVTGPSHALFNEETEQKVVLSPEIEPLLLNRHLQGVPFVPSVLNSTDELLDRFIQAMKKPSTINETTLRYIEARTDVYWKDHCKNLSQGGVCPRLERSSFEDYGLRIPLCF